MLPPPAAAALNRPDSEGVEAEDPDINIDHGLGDLQEAAKPKRDSDSSDAPWRQTEASATLWHIAALSLLIKTTQSLRQSAASGHCNRYNTLDDT